MVELFYFLGAVFAAWAIVRMVAAADIDLRLTWQVPAVFAGILLLGLIVVPLLEPELASIFDSLPGLQAGYVVGAVLGFFGAWRSNVRKRNRARELAES